MSKKRVNKRGETAVTGKNLQLNFIKQHVGVAHTFKSPERSVRLLVFHTIGKGFYLRKEALCKDRVIVKGGNKTVLPI